MVAGGAGPLRVLLIRPDHLGDVLLASPAAAVVGAALPSARVEWLVGPWSAEIARRYGSPDAVHTLSYLFLGGVRIAVPFPACGTAPVQDDLGCEDGGVCQPEAGSEAFQVTPVESGYLIDLPEIMVKACPEESILELRVDGLTRSTPVSGVVSKLSATTLLLETSTRTTLDRSSGSTLRLRVPARAMAFPRLGFQCGFFVCTCTGDDDCNDLFDGTECGGDAVCITDDAGGVWCICVRGGGVAIR